MSFNVKSAVIQAIEKNDYNLLSNILKYHRDAIKYCSDDLFNKCIRAQQLEIMNILVKYGVSVHKCTVENFNWLIENDHCNFISMFVHYGYPVSACSKKNFEIAKTKRGRLSAFLVLNDTLEDYTIEDFNLILINNVHVPDDFEKLLKKFPIKSISMETFDSLIDELLNYNKIVQYYSLFSIKYLLDNNYFSGCCSLAVYERCLNYANENGRCLILEFLKKKRNA